MRFITLSVFATLLSAPAFAADLGTYRPGTPYSSSVAAGADVCDNQCAGDAQCRGWNYVKPNPRAAGICEFLSSVSAPIASQISISGESQSDAPYYSRLTTGSTNTVRVGTQTAPRGGTVRVGQAPVRGQATRQVVRQAPPEQFKTQQASTQSVQNLSLTEQQNRYRQGQVGIPQRAVQPQIQGSAFRPILDGPSPQYRGQPIRQPQAQQPQSNQSPQRQTSRRATGPRRTQGSGYAAPQFQDPQFQGQGQATPQFQDPRFQDPRFQDPRFQDPRAQRPQQPVQQRGQSRPPIGQPIAATQPPARPQPSTPSQRLAQLTAQTRAQSAAVPKAGPVSLNPEQARTSLFGRLNDDVSIPTASAVPTLPVEQQPLDDVLAGGL